MSNRPVLLRLWKIGVISIVLWIIRVVFLFEKAIWEWTPHREAAARDAVILMPLLVTAFGLIMFMICVAKRVGSARHYSRTLMDRW
jgi:small-conductance mechanosensitive channel